AAPTAARALCLHCGSGTGESRAQSDCPKCDAQPGSPCRPRGAAVASDYHTHRLASAFTSSATISGTTGPEFVRLAPTASLVLRPRISNGTTSTPVAASSAP
ncbi:hypothetical protein, partial [Streptomyces rhizosphaericus]|uniref:zinc finger domain-containing protein n=1 Tax=Streptomyces rhizosphaericus TaxID=114699 RepID=UPI00117C5997